MTKKTASSYLSCKLLLVGMIVSLGIALTFLMYYAFVYTFVDKLCKDVSKKKEKNSKESYVYEDITPLDGHFSSTPTFDKIEEKSTAECVFPSNEANTVEKVISSAVPDCRLSSLRMTFEKNSCRFQKGWQIEPTSSSPSCPTPPLVG